MAALDISSLGKAIAQLRTGLEMLQSSPDNLPIAMASSSASN